MSVASSDLNLEGRLTQLWEHALQKFPEDWKTYLTEQGASFATNLINIGFFLARTMKVNDLESLLNNGRMSTVEDVCLKLNGANLSAVNKDTFCKLTCIDAIPPLDNHEDQAKLMKNILKIEKEQMANLCILFSSIQSSILIIQEFQALSEIWNEIKTAEYVLESSKVEFPKIQKRLDEHQKAASQLDSKIQEYYDNSHTEGKTRLSKQIDIMSRILNDDLDETKTMMSNIEIKLDKGIDRIGEIAKGQIMRAVSNFGQAVGSTLQLVTIGVQASTPFMAIQAGIAATFFVLGGLNVKAKICCDETLEKLRTAMTMVKTFEEKICDMKKITRRALDLLKNQFE